MQRKHMTQLFKPSFKCVYRIMLFCDESDVFRWPKTRGNENRPKTLIQTTQTVGENLNIQFWSLECEFTIVFFSGRYFALLIKT